MRLLLVGNPNAGKSTLFNVLARGGARVGNWHGVTVCALEKQTAIGGKKVTLVDLPGMYTAEGTGTEEAAARTYLRAHPVSPVLFVCECAALARCMPLFCALAAGRRAAIALTKARRFFKRGGRLDVAALSCRLGVPVFVAEGLRRDALKRQAARVFSAPVFCGKAASLGGIFFPPPASLSRADMLLTDVRFALPFFFVLLAAVFFVTFAAGAPGDRMKGAVEALFSDVFAVRAQTIASPVLRSLVCGGLLPGLGSVLGFLPQLMLLFLCLALLEESGLLSRLAYLTDGALSRVGLSGRAVFPLVMGFGCTAVAVLSARALDGRSTQRRTIACLPYLPCSAKLPVFLTLSASFFQDPFWGVCLLYALGVALAAFAAWLTGGRRQPFLLELAPLQCPRPVFIAKTLLFRTGQFIIKVATVIFAFLLASWLLSSFDVRFRLVAAEESMLARLCGGLGFLFAPAGMNDWRIVYAAAAGLVAKESVAGAIAMLYGEFPYGAASAFAFAVFILTCSPCVSAIAADAHECGWRRALFFAAFRTGSALLLCYLAYFVWRGGWALLPLAFAPLIAFRLLAGRHERIHRPRGHNAEKLHR